MKGFSRFAMCAFLALRFGFCVAYAEIPLNNLEGVGGVGFNPLAYLANPNKEGEGFAEGKIGKPSYGVWYVSLSDANIDWSSSSVTETFFNRLEVSYGREIINQEGADHIAKNNFGAKLLLREENFGNSPYWPAISLGVLHKRLDHDPAAADRDGTDFYLVATKTITQLPRPLVLSGGVLSTKGHVTGVYGFDNKRDEALFANVDLLALDNFIIGYEFEEGATFPGFKNADYWNLHVCWFANEGLTLGAAYINGGDEKSSGKVGLGEGFCLTLNYDF